MSHKQPIIPSVPLELWRPLYSAAEQFRKNAPWQWMDDCNVFGVQSKHSKQTLYGCVMGSAGQTFGLAIYRGAEGLGMFLALQNGDVEPEDETIHMRQNSLLAELTSKKYLEDFDLEIVNKLGLRPKGKNSWPLFRSMLPDHSPWPISELEALATLDVFEALKIYSKKIENDPEFDIAHGDSKIAVYKNKSGTWIPTWKPITTLMEEPIETLLQKPEPLNELLVQKLRSQNLRPGSVWEAAVFYLPSLIFDADRPYYPKACALVEEKTGYCIGVEIVRPEIDPLSKLRDLALERMAHFGYKPSAFRIQSPELLVGLETLKEALKIDIEMDQLESMPELVEALYKNSLKNEEAVRY
jgi:hypothetical protein